MSIGDRIEFVYNDKVRTGEIVDSNFSQSTQTDYVKVKHDDGTVKSYTVVKMQDVRVMA